MADDKKKKTKKKKEEEPAPAAAPAPEPAPAPAPAPAAAPARSSSKRAKRSGSNVFSMFSQKQVQEFKEAFQLMDNNKDGLLDKNDLRQTWDSLGRIVNDSDLESMLSEAPAPITFTIFLSIFGDRISGTDDEDVIQKAFAVYDEGDGCVGKDKLKHDLMTWGEKFSAAEIEEAFEQAPIVGNKIDLQKFCNILTRGVEEDEDQSAA